MKAREAIEEEALAAAVERVGGFEVVPIGASAEAPLRYLHATMRMASLPGRFRLKVVNPTRSDAEDISRCCRTANRVHGGLDRMGSSVGFRVPRWSPPPMGLESAVYVVEEIEDSPPLLDTASGLPMLVDRLLELELATQLFDAPLGAKPPWIESCNRSGYRQRLEFSLQGLYERQEITLREVVAVVTRFDAAWRPNKPLDRGRCVAHGDFSCGNVRGSGELWLIDFEHAHVGAPVLDMTHLFVNLMFDERAETARGLLQQYDTARAKRGLQPTRDVFAALLLERAAGKWNAMRPPTPVRRERIRAILLEGSG